MPIALNEVNFIPEQHKFTLKFVDFDFYVRLKVLKTGDQAFDRVVQTHDQVHQFFLLRDFCMRFLNCI